MCVFVCQGKQAASCQRGGVKRPEGFEHSRPAKLTVCLDNGIFPSPSPSLHPSPFPTFAKNLSRQESPSSPPPLLSAHVHSLFLYLRSASISHYLPSSLLFIEECPPTSPPAEQPHCHQSAPIVSSRGDWYLHPPPFLSSLSPPSSLYTFSPPLSLHLWHTLFSFLPSTFCLTFWPPVFKSIYFFSSDLKQMVYALLYTFLIKIHYVSKHRPYSLLE